MAEIEITLLDAPYRFNATSEDPEKGEGPYTVDLKHWCCSCGRQWFHLRIQLRDGKITRKQAACKHMRAALWEAGVNHMAVLIEYWDKQEAEAKAAGRTIGTARVESNETIEKVDG